MLKKQHDLKLLYLYNFIALNDSQLKKMRSFSGDYYPKYGWMIGQLFLKNAACEGNPKQKLND